MDKASPITNIETNNDVPNAIRTLSENGWQLTRSSPTRLLFERFASHEAYMTLKEKLEGNPEEGDDQPNC